MEDDTVRENGVDSPRNPEAALGVVTDKGMTSDCRSDLLSPQPLPLAP